MIQRSRKKARILSRIESWNVEIFEVEKKRKEKETREICSGGGGGLNSRLCTSDFDYLKRFERVSNVFFYR